MHFLEVRVKTAFIVHGYDDNNQEITEEVKEEAFTTKVVAVERIQSISEQYILVKSSHGRDMYWEYEGNMEALKFKLSNAGLLL
ncbi:hypothetical protein [Kangiella shandongensis]|uniref:hypothetical protein n=1 Tax=Kangiella shandongensis TaxID=2763258 RepID=UPI001CBCF424|nr:hypothetical protein [Kangiella shandongensis]